MKINIKDNVLYGFKTDKVDKSQSGILKIGINTLKDTSFWESLQEELNDIAIDDKIFGDAGVNSKGDSEFSVDKKVRDSKVVFLDGERYSYLNSQLFDIIQEYNNNESGLNYLLTGIESMQYGIYSDGGFYDWHVDCYPSAISITTKKTLSGTNIIKVNRKLSISIFLNDPDEYEGGELDIEVDGPRKDPRYSTYKLPKGSIVVFPSDKWHRVRPVTSGIRKSLVAWLFGPPFR
tara:strand:- start:49 stop:750 length:702 start_codon:yes stop_codon:yes gene_type:complete